MVDIKIKNLNFSYEKELVLQDINLEFNSCDFLAIIGPNGGGKSTLLKLILGLLKPINGNIEFANHSLTYVPQNVNANKIFPITCLEVVLMGRLKGRRFYGKEDYEKARKALEQVGMLDLAHKNVNALSGGQRQRVFIARALCSEAKIILLDEPTSSIDTNGQIQIYSLLKKLNENLGIIVVSHDVNVAVGFADKVAYVNKTLFMHNIAKDEVKQRVLEKLKSSSSHVCPMELINEHFCSHKEC